MEGGNGVASISVLPEGCITEIISKTSPRDACTASAISRGFKYAADSDPVWERFLPPDYREIIARSVSPLVNTTKKQLYFLLCDSHILLDGGRLSFALNKWTGKKCYMLKARELSIIWADTPQYWKWKSIPESRFSEVAELVSVCWLYIRGKMGTEILSPKTSYAAYLVFKLGGDCYGFDYPAKSLVRFVGDREEGTENEPNDWVEEETSMVYLDLPADNVAGQEPNDNARIPKERMDGWMEIELGEFFNDQGEDGEVEMRLMEIRRLHWKYGLIVEGIELRPKQNE